MGPSSDVTFVASANCVVYRGGARFADVAGCAARRSGCGAEDHTATRDRRGRLWRPPAISALRDIARGLPIVACLPRLGAARNGTPVGSLADEHVCFHPVKPITTGEGGASSPAMGARGVRVFRGHGIVGDFRQREAGLMGTR